MKKFVAISIMAALLLGGIAAVAMADANNWVVSLKATDASGNGYANTLRLGWKAGYTNGIDTAPAVTQTELVEPTAPAPGGGNAVVGAYLDNSGKVYNYDYRASEATDPSTKTFNLAVFSQGVWAPSTIKVTLTASSMAYTYKMPLVIKWKDADKGGDWTTAVFTASNPIPATFSMNLANKTAAAGITNPDIIIMTPEPSSMVAMLSGLAGLAGFAIRRRRA